MPFRKTQNSCGCLFDASPWSDLVVESDARGTCKVRRKSCEEFSQEQLDSFVVTADSLLSSGQLIEPGFDVTDITPPAPSDVLGFVSQSLLDDE